MNRRTLLICLGLALLVLLVQDAEGKKKSSSESEEKKGSSEDKPKKKVVSKESEESEEKDESEEKEKKAVPKGPFKRVKTCRGQEWEQPHSISKAYKKCIAQRKKDKEDNVKDAKRGPACLAECLWKENDLITGEDSKMKVDQKAVDDFVEAVLPSNLKSSRPRLAKEWKLCKSEIEADEDNDEKCTKFKPYFSCIRTAFQKHCAGSGVPPNMMMVPAKGSGVLGLLG